VGRRYLGSITFHILGSERLLFKVSTSRFVRIAEVDLTLHMSRFQRYILYSQTYAFGLLRSFAMVTDEPPQEIAQAGHDRCPIFLREDLMDVWLNPKGKPLKELHAVLGEKHLRIIRMRWPPSAAC
jgi:hypothetical protein